MKSISLLRNHHFQAAPITPFSFFLAFLLLVILPIPIPNAAASEFNGGNHTLIAWNDLGMHCMDDDYAVFSLLPPFNTINAQLIDPNGNLVTNDAGITLTYEAIADLDGSANTTAAGKTNFWDHSAALYNAPLNVDEGLPTRRRSRHRAQPLDRHPLPGIPQGRHPHPHFHLRQLRPQVARRRPYAGGGGISRLILKK